MFAALTGAFLGMVTSNARHNSDVIIPRLNFTLPAAVLAPLAVYASTGGTRSQLATVMRGTDARDGWRDGQQTHPC